MAVLLLREYGQGKQACGRGAHGIAGRGHGGCAVFLRRGLTAPPGEAAGDTEGLQQMRTLARNMAFLMRGIQLAKERYGLPQKEPLTYMNFIREGQ